jgi:hypothetical protein
MYDDIEKLKLNLDVDVFFSPHLKKTDFTGK